MYSGLSLGNIPANDLITYLSPLAYSPVLGSVQLAVPVLPINLTLDETAYQEYDKATLAKFYEELEFKSLLKELNSDEVKVDSTFKFQLIDNNISLDDVLTNESYFALLF